MFERLFRATAGDTHMEDLSGRRTTQPVEDPMLARAEALWDAQMEAQVAALERPKGKYRIWYDPKGHGWRVQSWAVWKLDRAQLRRHYPSLWDVYYLAPEEKLGKIRRDIIAKEPQCGVQWDDLVYTMDSPRAPKLYETREAALAALDWIINPVQQETFYGDDGQPV